MEMEKRPARLTRATTKPKEAKNRTMEKNGSFAVSPEQRYRMINDAAYFIAEKRCFDGGSPVEDWLQAEKEVDEILGRINNLMSH